MPQIAACLWCIHLVLLVAVYDQAGHVTRHCSGAPLLLPVLAHHRSSLYRDTQHPHNISTAVQTRGDCGRVRSCAMSELCDHNEYGAAAAGDAYDEARPRWMRSLRATPEPEDAARPAWNVAR